MKCDDCSGFGYTQDENDNKEICDRCGGTGIEPEEE
jgi:DnaJ-class molecular chaperone